MSQNSGEDKKVHPVERNYLASQKIIESIMLRFFFKEEIIQPDVFFIRYQIPDKNFPNIFLCIKVHFAM